MHCFGLGSRLHSSQQLVRGRFGIVLGTVLETGRVKVRKLVG